MQVIDFEQAAHDRARVEKRRKDAISSQLLLRRLRRHHYDYAPDNLKFLPSPIVGNPLINHIASLIEGMEPIHLPETDFPDFVNLEEARTVKSGSVKTILGLVSRYYKVPVDQIVGSRRTGKITLARQVGMYLAMEHTTQSGAGIARTFCRDHTTVLHGHGKIGKDLLKNDTLALQVMILRKQLSAIGEMPDPALVRAVRQTRKIDNANWDMESQVKLVKLVRQKVAWPEISREFGISMSAVFNKYLRMEAAHQAFVAAEGA